MCYVAITIFTMNKSDWKQNVLIQRRKIKITFYENGSLIYMTNARWTIVYRLKSCTYCELLYTMNDRERKYKQKLKMIEHVRRGRRDSRFAFSIWIDWMRTCVFLIVEIEAKLDYLFDKYVLKITYLIFLCFFFSLFVYIFIYECTRIFSAIFLIYFLYNFSYNKNRF